MMSTPLDPRINVFRPDLADASLCDQVKAARYVEPVLRQCLRGVLPLFNSPLEDARQISQIRYGEFVDVFELRDDGFAWVQNRSDRYVGYVPTLDGFGDSIAMLSNRVAALRTFVYPEPNIKAPPIDELTLGSYASVAREEGRFLELINGGYVVADHVMATEYTFAPDYVFTAGRMLHTPYLWGGRTPKGIDCSGLVQLSLEMAGIEAPRDSDQQREALGQPLSSHWRDHAWHRGDIVHMLYKDRSGHIGFMTGTDHIIHANATSTMSTIVEPLADLVARGYNVVACTNAHDLHPLVPI